MKARVQPPVQFGLGERQNEHNLRNIWVEIPGFCNLACSYCFSDGGTPDRARQSQLLTDEEYSNILQQAATLGVDSIGIPGAGEPLMPINRLLTLRLLKNSADLGFYSTLFTTGEFLTPHLIDHLYEMPVEVMLKVNSLRPDVQDAFVSDPARGRIITGYGAKRNEALRMLVDRGFNDEKESMRRYGRKTRLAFVTSILASEAGPSNLEELPEMLRYARANNIMFDADVLLRKGRATTCGLCAEDTVIRDTYEQLRAIDEHEFGNVWPETPSYIGTICDRFSYHLYIDQYGGIRPCLGATGVALGNIRSTTLEQAWNSTEMRVIRSRNYRGPCADECTNFTETNETGRHSCNSCLGRYTEDLTNDFLLKNGYVQTAGCLLKRKK